MRLIPIAMAFMTVLAVPALAQADPVQPLVDAGWVVAHANDANVVVVDIRANVEKTDLGAKPYIANAVIAPYGQAGWRANVDGVPGMVPPIAQISAMIGKLGISNKDHVVIVPWGTNSSDFGGATRVYWTFKYLGDNNVSILNGGWRQYVAANGTRVATPAKRAPVQFVADVQPQLLATTADVEAALKNGTPLIDARPTDQYNGTVKNVADRVAGTLPGAISMPNSEFYSSKYASFAKPTTVAQLIKPAKLGTNGPSIEFCNTGHLASVVWFGVSELLGNKNAKLYDGSMAQWTKDPSRPVQP